MPVLMPPKELVAGPRPVIARQGASVQVTEAPTKAPSSTPSALGTQSLGETPRSASEVEAPVVANAPSPVGAETQTQTQAAEKRKTAPIGVSSPVLAAAITGA